MLSVTCEREATGQRVVLEGTLTRVSDWCRSTHQISNHTREPTAEQEKALQFLEHQITFLEAYLEQSIRQMSQKRLDEMDKEEADRKAALADRKAAGVVVKDTANKEASQEFADMKQAQAQQQWEKDSVAKAKAALTRARAALPKALARKEGMGSFLAVDTDATAEGGGGPGSCAQ